MEVLKLDSNTDKWKVSELELLYFLTDFEINKHHYDLHNDYKCIQIEFNNEEETLRILFESNDESLSILITFYKVLIAISNLSFDYFDGNYLVIDTLYRGGPMKGENISIDHKGYMYLDFCEGPSFEFWSYEYSIYIINNTK